MTRLSRNIRYPNPAKIRSEIRAWLCRGICRYTLRNDYFDLSSRNIGPSE